jgi:hypothetical protein
MHLFLQMVVFTATVHVACYIAYATTSELVRIGNDIIFSIVLSFALSL